MLSKRQLQRAKAVECQRSADSASDPGVRMAYARAAEAWYRLSAVTQRPAAKKPKARRSQHHSR